MVAEQTEFEALIECLNDGVIMRDNDLLVTRINPALTDLLGYDEAALLGKSVRDVISIKHIGGRPLLAQKVAAANLMKANEPTRGTYIWTKKDGTKIIIDSVTSPYRINGHLKGSITVVRDISEQAAVDKAKTEFVSLAAHQLRTPLSSINWYLEMVANDELSTLSEDQQNYLSEVREANGRMVALVNDLLNVSRIEVGGFAVNPEPTDLEVIIKTVLIELGNVIARKALHITTAFSGPTDRYSIDPQLALIVLQNLIGNAVKYTPEGGSIDIYAILDTEKLLITIDDTGYGIPRSQQEKIFTKLFRADNVVKRDTEGTGLGLYLVKAIIEKAGGTIDFVSKANQGTTFSVIFPSHGMRKQSGAYEIAGSHRHQIQTA